MISLKKEYIIMIILLSVLLGMFLAYIVIENNLIGDFNSSIVDEETMTLENDISLTDNSKTIDKEENENKLKTIMVYITGSVKEPGVYTVKENSRVIDLFNKAGANTVDSDLTQINMAAFLKDGQRIYIPSISEREVQNNNTLSAENIYSSSDGKININSASTKELEKLTGIGKSKAASIVKYRENNGPFTNINDLDEVNGIGPAILSNIKDEVSLR